MDATSPRGSVGTTEPLGDQEIAFDTAAEHLATNVPVAAPYQTIGDIRRAMAGRRFDTSAAVAVCEDGRFEGLLRMEDLLAADENSIACDVMDVSPPMVRPGTDQEVAGWTAVQRSEATLAVTDEGGRFLGLIPPQRMLAVLLWEHEEDMARLGGFLHDTQSARLASREPVTRRLVHRLPWLVMGLMGAFVATAIMESFEREVARNVAIAFFIPGIVYMADAVGTQTEALVIRGLSVGVPIREIVRRELATGALIGVALGGAFLPIAAWRWGGDVALAAALALIAASGTATLVAMVLPAALSRLGMDPAFGSGPLATVIQDLLSILIYLGVAVALLD